ncbi:hypothetical protein CMK18_20910 [Candidatus Poribacteria bacterium]|nr:hypothetical protein [Candidatus Poribacteria bacterium]
MNNIKKQKVVLLGGSGFVGQYLRAGITKYEFISTFYSEWFPDGIFFDLEKTNLSSIIEESNCSHVFFLAGMVKFDEVKTQPERAWRINVEASIERIKEAIDNNVVVVYFSSESIFSGEEGNYTEENIPNPKFSYGKQKFEVEKFIVNNTDKFFIFRLSKVYSSDREPKSLVTSWINQLEKDEDIHVATDNIFCPIHVNDVVAFVEALIDSRKYGVYNVCSPKPYSRSEMLKIVMDEYLKYFTYSGTINHMKLNTIKGAEMTPKNTSLVSQKSELITGFTAQNFLYWGRRIVQSHAFNRVL